MGTNSWEWIFNMSILGVYIVDIYNIATQPLSYEGTYNAFFCGLTEDVINENINSRTNRPPSKRTGIKSPHVPVRKYVEAYILQSC